MKEPIVVIIEVELQTLRPTIAHRKRRCAAAVSRGHLGAGRLNAKKQAVPSTGRKNCLVRPIS